MKTFGVAKFRVKCWKERELLCQFRRIERKRERTTDQFRRIEKERQRDRQTETE